MKRLDLFARAISLLALTFLTANCGTDGASSGGASPARSGGSLSEGKRLYLTRCTSCHAPEPIGNYLAHEWRSLLPEMADEAKLNASQQQAVLSYVLSGTR